MIALAQINTKVGDIAANTAKIIAAIHEAKANNAEIVVFPELTISGYPPMDLLTYDGFIDACKAALHTISEATEGIACIVGVPTRNNDLGKKSYNSAIFIENKKITHTVHKTLLPDYDVFDEYRYFEPNTTFNVIEYKHHRIALTICEDIWNVPYTMYKHNPMDFLAAQQPTIMINISASPYNYKHLAERNEILKQNFKLYSLPIVYCNQIGANTELIFDGNSSYVDVSGNIHNMPAFMESIGYVSLENNKTINFIENVPLTPSPMERAGVRFNADSEIATIHDALVLGIKDYFQKLGFSKAVLGLSGGIDSAVVLALAAEALGAANVHSILMPSQYSSEHSVADSLAMTSILSSPYDIIAIKEVFDSFENGLATVFAGTGFGIAEENIQSRIRGTLLMAYSNKHGHILLNTSNKSELSVGYGTLYGDMNGAISILGDLYKTQIYALAHHINRNGVIIPENIMLKAPSAELRPNQKDSDSLPDYDVLDNILKNHIEHKKSRSELYELGYEKAIIDKIVNLCNIAEFKRFQTCPILRVSWCSFGLSRKIPIVSTKF